MSYPRTNNDDDEYNDRQFYLMLRFIVNFEVKKKSLKNLIGDLEGLGNALKKPSDNWLKIFWSHWGVLEDVYSLMKFEKRRNLKKQDLVKIETTLAALKSLITSKIKNPKEDL